MKVPSHLLLLAMALLPHVSSNKFTDSIKKGVQAIKHPVQKAVLSFQTEYCEPLKMVLGKTNGQIQETGDLDVSLLEIQFITPNARTSFNLSSVSTDLPELPKGLDIASCQTLRVFSHGYSDSPGSFKYQLINEAYQNTGNTCILALDSSHYITTDYFYSSTFTHFIGSALGKSLADLVQKTGFTADRIHLIGHSLGAHISGFAGKEFARLTGQKVARLTGLDPALPCFTTVTKDFRLDSSDAEFVDVIHTNAGVNGYSDALGHVDYYPNGGSQQPECYSEGCNHDFVLHLFAETILTPEAFPAVKCNTFKEFKKGRCSGEINLMGEGSRPDVQGKFFLQTKATSPYSLGEDGTSYKKNKLF